MSLSLSIMWILRIKLRSSGVVLGLFPTKSSLWPLCPNFTGLHKGEEQSFYEVVGSSGGAFTVEKSLD